MANLSDQRFLRTVLRRALRSGAAASIVSIVVAAGLGRRRTGSAASAANAPSHWIWKRRALRRHGLSARYTLPGYLIHHASSVWWALAFEAWRQHRPRHALAKAAAVSALAALVDYRVVPKRLTPGFEAHLSRPAVALVYAAFAAGLAWGARVREAPLRRHR